MEEDKFKKLFADFEPELSSDAVFEERLERKLDNVEIIRRNNAVVLSNTKKAVAIAALVGFVVGILLAPAVPYLSGLVSEWLMTLPEETVLSVLAANFPTFAWLIVAAASVICAINTYDLSLSLLRPKDSSAE